MALTFGGIPQDTNDAADPMPAWRFHNMPS